MNRRAGGKEKEKKNKVASTMYLHNPPLNSSAQAHLTSAYYTSSICRLSTSFPNTLLASINIILNTGDTLHIMAPSVLRLASSDCGEMLSMFTSINTI